VKLLLTAVSGPKEGTVFTIEANKSITFGRKEPSISGFEDDMHMSSVHCKVSNLGDRGEIKDCNSTNGTWLNNRKITAETLREGDRIRAGMTMMTVEFLFDLVPAEIVPEELDKTQAPSLLPLEDEAPAMARREPLIANSSRKEEISQAPQPVVGPPVRHRAINPFDSVDFSNFEIAPTAPPTSEYPATENEKRFGGPISDSSVTLPPSGNNGDYRKFTRRTTQESAENFAVVLDSLAVQWSMQLAVHFQKIRIEPPVECAMQSILKGNREPCTLPLRMPWNEVNSTILIPLMPRLCRSDACIAFVGYSATTVGTRMEEMLRVGVEGFSEPDGFLPFFWPSMLMSILDSRGPEIFNSLFNGKIAGALMCSPRNRHEIIAVANDSLYAVLAESQFVPI
jgi:FHA domain